MKMKVGKGAKTPGLRAAPVARMPRPPKTPGGVSRLSTGSPVPDMGRDPLSPALPGTYRKGDPTDASPFLAPFTPTRTRGRRA